MRARFRGGQMLSEVDCMLGAGGQTSPLIEVYCDPLAEDWLYHSWAQCCGREETRGWGKGALT